MAPEVARMLPVTNRPAVDAYGLGCILHDLGHAGTGAGTEDDEVHSGVTGLYDARSNTVGTDTRLRMVLVQRALLNFEPCVASRVPASLAALLRALMAVEPSARPTAEHARKQLASMAADSVTWAVEVAVAPLQEGGPAAAVGAAAAPL